MCTIHERPVAEDWQCMLVYQRCKHESSIQTVQTRQTLVRVKNRMPKDRRKWVIYEIPCKDCEKLRNWQDIEEESQWTQTNRQSWSVHIEDHRIDWEEAKVIPGQEFYWKRRVTEGIMIHQHNQQTINVDCGLNLSKLWHASLDKPTCVNHYNFIFFSA